MCCLLNTFFFGIDFNMHQNIPYSKKKKKLMETYETTQIKNRLKKVTPISIGYIKIFKYKKKIEIVQIKS